MCGSPIGGSFLFMCNITLSSQSSESQIKSYFNSVLTLSKSGEKFPIDLDDVWQICYAQKVKALQFLTESGQFYENEDYILLSQKVKQNGEISANVGSGGHNRQVYMLSVPCMEYLIARKVRAVFEVYRRVFHEFLNAKRMSSDEAIAYGYGKALEKINRQSTIIARQSKQLQKYKAQLESEIAARKMKRLAATQVRRDERISLISDWLNVCNLVGFVSLAEMKVDFYEYCKGMDMTISVASSTMGKILKSMGLESLRRRDGMYYILKN